MGGVTEYDERVLLDWRLPNGKYKVKLKQYERLKCDTNLEKHHASSVR